MWLVVYFYVISCNGKGIFTLITCSNVQQPPLPLEAGPVGGEAVIRFKQRGLTRLISAAKPASCSHPSGFPQKEGGSIQEHDLENLVAHRTGDTDLPRVQLVPLAAHTHLDNKDPGFCLPGRKELMEPVLNCPCGVFT